jgi:predicted peroxiredoxin
MKKYLIIANSGPEDPNRATVPFITAKALAEKGHKPTSNFVCGELGMPSKLADLIVEADNVIGF